MDNLWWQDKAYFIEELKNEDSGLTYLYARETEAGWEYAITFWSWGNATLQKKFLNGKMIDPDKEQP